MAKKKKTQLKPVARGFATTSVPKKVTSKEAEETEVAPHNKFEESGTSVSEKTSPGGVTAASSALHDEFDPEKVEEQALQNLVDKLQERTEKEITRAVKAIETDRRFAKALPCLELDSVLIDRILDLASSSYCEAKKTLEESEEKAVARIGITYGVLRRLGYSESRVEECLRAIQGVDVDEAIEWLYFHCTEAELEDKRDSESVEPRTPRTPVSKSSRMPGTPRTPVDFLASSMTTMKPKKLARLDVNAPTFVPAHLRCKDGLSHNDTSDPNSSTSHSGTSSPVYDDPAMHYARTRIKLESLSDNGRYASAAVASQAQELQKKLVAFKNDYFFDEREADAIYRIERDRANATALLDRLRGSPEMPLTEVEGNSKKQQSHFQPQLPNPPIVVHDIFDDDSDDSASGGILEILEALPATEFNSQGKTIRIRDMALPKHWSGRTPKILLQETVAKADRYAAIGYTIISGASRAKRAALSIRWEGRKMDEWCMDDVACRDETQAEQYIATIALHALTFPPTEGFAGVPTTISGSLTFFRLLPAVFRDLWDELETTRKTRDDAINRNQWAKLRSIIETKLEINNKSNKQISDAEVHQIPQSSPVSNEIASEQLAATFRVRQASVEYQEMLAQRNTLPIAAYRAKIVEILEESQVLVLSVSRELGDPANAVGTIKSLVGYSIRLESNTTRNTRLAFVTNGIALRMLEGGTGHSGQGTAFDEITVNGNIIFMHDKYYQGKARLDWTEESPAGDDDDDETVQESIKLEKRYSSDVASTINLLDERLIPYDLIIRLLERICFDDPSNVLYSAAILIFMPGLAEIRRLNDILAEHPSFGDNHFFQIFPLHSTLSSENQGAVFDVLPEGVRKIVIDITCVIDTGKHREMRFDEKRQISRLVETFIARSNAAQRRGRAGRVRNGLCFHLFTKLRYETQMPDNPLPEMMRLSLSDLALRIKIMKVKLGSCIEDVLSRALDPPTSINVQRAVSMLVEVGALTVSEEITPMGRLLSKLPTDVHLGKFLLTATLFRCLDPALTIAAALNSKSPFLSPFGFEQEADRAKQAFKSEIDNSDFLTIHNAFSSWRRASVNPSFARKFCRVNYLSHQSLQQIEELRQQLLGFAFSVVVVFCIPQLFIPNFRYLIDSSFIQVDSAFVRELSRARYGRNKTRFVVVPTEFDTNSNSVPLINAALTAGLFPKILAIDPTNGQTRTISNNQQASFHPSSVNFGKKPADFGVNHLTYFTLMHSKRLYVRETGPVDDMAVLLLCGDCDYKVNHS
ncbi:hypothetical protein C0992_012340 [Termitomyces sp. T32_za158]|nr:hypothetical protein C0992_012340 [Termitomyces sp. T32_za158]